MVYNQKVVTDNSPHVPMTSTPVKKPIARKSLYLFTNILNVKNKTVECPVGAAKSKRRAMKVVNIQWTNKIK